MAIDVDSSVLWLGVGRGVRVIGSGDIGRILLGFPGALGCFSGL